jgi:hypothetical protein
MQRRHWFELHDHPRCPELLRNLITDGLEAMWSAKNIFSPIVPQLREVLAETGSSRVIDLCSGGGGPWPKLAGELATVPANDPAAEQIKIVLTDLYPNRRTFEHLCGKHDTLDFFPEPVDATSIPPELSGFRTIFTALHHFQPHQARAILQDAFEQRQGIGVFESTMCRPRAIMVVFLVPLLTLWLTPGIRPFRWSRVLLTYVLPVVPFILWFDGVLSCLRSYSLADLEELVAGFDAEDYRWTVGITHGRWIGIPYLIGRPVLVRELDLDEPEQEEVFAAQIEKPA